MNRLLVWVTVLGLGLTGCSAPTGVSVTGTVTLDGKTLPGAMVSFRPMGQMTEGLGGSGMTGADGKYVIKEARGGKGIASGDYTVVINRRLRPARSSPSVRQLPPRRSATASPEDWNYADG